MKSHDIFSVQDKVVVITGAASGIGRTIAETLSENGALVVLADRDEAGLATAIAEIGGRAESLSLDVTDAEGVIAAFQGVASRHGRLDVVFANAGVSAGPGYGAPVGTLDNVDLELFESSGRINLTGAVATLKAAARVMKPQGHGAIVVTTSAAATTVSALPGYGYHAHKAGIAHVTRVAANELAAFGIRVNGFAPGAFPTNMAGGRLKEAEAGAKFAALAPMKRLARMEEIAGVALLLASDASSYMTGVIIPVDGGVAAV